MKWLNDILRKVRGAKRKRRVLSQEDLLKFYIELSSFMDNQGNHPEAGFLACIADCYRDPVYRYFMYKAVAEVHNAKLANRRVFVYGYEGKDSSVEHHQAMLDYALKKEYYEVAAALIRNKEVWEKQV